MGGDCVAATCHQKRTKESRDAGITFHLFPKNLERRKRWSRLMSRGNTWLASDWSALCSTHFKPENFDRTGQTVRLRENVEPSMFDLPQYRNITGGRVSSQSCDVANCTSRYMNRLDGISFFRYPYPGKPEIRKQWVLAVRGTENYDPPSYAMVCSLHFKPEDFDRTGKTVHLKKNVVPSIFRVHRRGLRKRRQWEFEEWKKRMSHLFKSPTVPTWVTKLKHDASVAALVSLGDADAQQVVIKTEADAEQIVVKQECCSDEAMVLLTRIPDSAISNSQLTKTSDIDSQQAVESMETGLENLADRTPETQHMDTHDSSQPLLREIRSNGLFQSSQKDKVEYSQDFSFLSVSKDETKFHFYTGLSVSQFSHLMSYLGPNLDNLSAVAGTVRAARKQKPLIRKCKLSYTNQLFLTLLKLRQAHPNKVLANRFNIDVKTVAFIVKTWIYFMYSQTTELRKRMLPSRQLTQENLPECFSHSKNARVIVDYFEILAQQPRNVFDHDGIYASYKTHSTYKVLIGISPLGGVAFLSDAYEDELSDIELFLKSGLVDRLEPEDLVLADTGFAIQQLTNTNEMNSNVPPAQENKNRLTPQEQLLTKSIARLKKYKIIDRPVCLSMKPFLSQIVHVVGLLVNYQEPLVAK